MNLCIIHVHVHINDQNTLVTPKSAFILITGLITFGHLVYIVLACYYLKSNFSFYAAL